MTYPTPVGRGRPVARRALLALSTILASGLAAPVLAQTTPPVRQSLDANGVDLFSGAINVRTPGLSIGSGDKALTYSWLWYGFGWTTDQTIAIAKYNTLVIVNLGSESKRFNVSGSSFVSTEGDGSTLTFDGSTIYTFTKPDGTVVRFSKAFPTSGYEAIATDITTPDGGKVLIEWTTGRYCVQAYPEEPDTCRRYGTTMRPAGFRNHANYAVQYTYASDSLDGVPADLQSWNRLVGARASNLASGSVTQSVGITRSSDGTYSYLTIGDPLGRVTQYRSSGNQLLGIKRPGSAGEDVTIGYSGDRVSSITTAAGTTNYASHDPGDGTRRVTVTNPAAQATGYVFDLALQRMTSMTDATGRTTTWQYDGLGRVTRMTMPEGDYTQLTYDARGNVVEQRRGAKPGSGQADIVTTAVFEAGCSNLATCNRPQATTDAKGGVTEYSYDPTHGGVAAVTAPAGANGVRPQVRFGYTAHQAPGTGGTVYELTSTSTCRTAGPGGCIGGADESRTSTTYEPGNLLPVSRTVATGDGSVSATTTLGYDAAGNVTSVDGPLPGTGDVTRIFHNAVRRPTLTVGPDPDGGGPLRNRAVEKQYDVKDRVTAVVRGVANSDGSGFQGIETVANGYDAVDRKVTTSLVSGGATHALTQYAYDAAGRLECVVQRMNPGAFGSVPGACSLGAQGTDGPDRITRTAYDQAGRVNVVVTGQGTSEASADTVTYTANGQVHHVIDGNGNATRYDYDGFDRLSATVYPSKTVPGDTNPADYERFGYDQNGNVVSRRLRDGQVIGYTYDALNRVTFKDVPGGVPEEFDISYQYDNLGRLTRATDAATHFSAFGYDALGRKTSEQSNWTTRHFGYDPAGRMTRLTWGDGFFVTYEYDQTGAMTLVRENGGFALASFGYDNLGRRTRLTRGNGTETGYSYDAASRLNGLSHDLAGTAHDLGLAFGYNAAGQIASRTSSNDAYAWTGHGNTDRGYGVNGLNQATSAGDTTLGYDGRGNLTQSGATAYGYTSENRLATAQGYVRTYDPLGRFHWMSNGAPLTWMQYDGDRLIEERYDHAPVRRYVYGPGIDEPLVWYEGAATGDRRWLHADERGSIVAVTDGAGNAMAINTYDEYGRPGASNIGRFQYTGQKWVPELGLYDYKARMYSPQLGRFMQTDPIGYDDGLNLYGYVGGDPVNKVDPTGLAEICSVHDAASWNGREVVVQAFRVCREIPEPQDRGFRDNREQGGGDRATSPQNVCTAPLTSSGNRGHTINSRRAQVRAELARALDSASRNGLDPAEAVSAEIGKNAARLAPGRGTWIKGQATSADGNRLYGAITAELGFPLGGTLAFGDWDEIIDDALGLIGIRPYDGNFGPDSQSAKDQIAEGARCPG